MAPSAPASLASLLALALLSAPAVVRAQGGFATPPDHDNGVEIFGLKAPNCWTDAPELWYGDGRMYLGKPAGVPDDKRYGLRCAVASDASMQCVDVGAPDELSSQDALLLYAEASLDSAQPAWSVHLTPKNKLSATQTFPSSDKAVYSSFSLPTNGTQFFFTPGTDAPFSPFVWQAGADAANNTLVSMVLHANGLAAATSAKSGPLIVEGRPPVDTKRAAPPPAPAPAARRGDKQRARDVLRRSAEAQ